MSLNEITASVIKPLQASLLSSAPPMSDAVEQSHNERDAHEHDPSRMRAPVHSKQDEGLDRDR